MITEVETLLTNISDQLTTDDYYFIYLIVSNLAEYGINNQDSKHLKELMKAKKSWFNGFDSRSLSMIKLDHNGDKLAGEGLTQESLRLIELCTSFAGI